jgi:hypothetical protein
MTVATTRPLLTAVDTTDVFGVDGITGLILRVPLINALLVSDRAGAIENSLATYQG